MLFQFSGGNHEPQVASLPVLPFDPDISQYDILPDRVIVYLWPRAGGTKLDFQFRPRFALRAQTAPSLVYDYYNPEARAIAAPTRFVVK